MLPLPAVRKRPTSIRSRSSGQKSEPEGSRSRCAPSTASPGSLLACRRHGSLINKRGVGWRGFPSSLALFSSQSFFDRAAPASSRVENSRFLAARRQPAAEEASDRKSPSATPTPAGAARQGSSGERMSTATERAPSREDFAALLDESYGENEAFEGSVIKGIVVAIEKDVAVIDVGLKTEGPRRPQGIHRPWPRSRSRGRRRGRGLSGAHRERARRSRHLARQGAPRGELGQARKGLREPTKRSKASSSIRSRAASPSISTAPWPSCRARRSTSVRSATSAR